MSNKRTKYGGPLNTTIFICTLSTMVHNYVTGSTSGSDLTIRNAFTRPMII